MHHATQAISAMLLASYLWATQASASPIIPLPLPALVWECNCGCWYSTEGGGQVLWPPPNQKPISVTASNQTQAQNACNGYLEESCQGSLTEDGPLEDGYYSFCTAEPYGTNDSLSGEML